MKVQTKVISPSDMSDVFNVNLIKTQALQRQHVKEKKTSCTKNISIQDLLILFLYCYALKKHINTINTNSLGNV